MDSHWKNCSPKETIKNIHTILEHFDITLNSNFSETNPLGVFSTHVTAVGFPPSYGTNGKGISPQYALASGEAEFIERFQTLMLFALPENELKFKDEYVRSSDNLIMCPYLDLFTGDMVNLQSGFGHSTGMASGNTDAEAIVHAICEIVERQTNLDLARGELQVNTRLPMSLCPYDYKQIEQVFGGKMQLFDIGKFGIPTVALLCRNEETRQIIFHLDCGPSLDLAIERCFTEFFQNNSFPNIQYAHWQGELDDIACPDYHIKYGSLVDYHVGPLPKIIVEQLEDAMVPMEIRDYSYLNSENALIKYFIKQAKKWFPSGVFLRDYKWAGFPTVFLYVPDLINEEYASMELFMHIYKYCIDELRVYTGTRPQAIQDLIIKLNQMYFSRIDPDLRRHRSKYERKTPLIQLYDQKVSYLQEQMMQMTKNFAMNKNDFSFIFE